MAVVDKERAASKYRDSSWFDFLPRDRSSIGYERLFGLIRGKDREILIVKKITKDRENLVVRMWNKRKLNSSHNLHKRNT